MSRMSAGALRADGGRGSGLAAALLVAGAVLVSPAVSRAQRVPVAARALPRGHVLTAEDIAYAPTAGARPVPAPDPHLPGGRPPTPGWTTKRVIAAGEPLRAPAVAPPEAIRAGQAVDVLWSDGAVKLRLKGVAAHAAALGARVTVRVDARRRLEGVAVAPGAVRLR